MVMLWSLILTVMESTREYAMKTVLLAPPLAPPTTTESSSAVAALSKLRPALAEAEEEEEEKEDAAHHVNDVFCAPTASMGGELDLSQQ